LTEAQFVRAVQRLLDRTSHWTPARWSTPGASTGQGRGDLVHGLVQRLADLGAEVEGRPPRPVPRLASDLALPDQLRVVAADLTAAGATESMLVGATDLVRTTTRDLG
jgi:hypothetical protein